MHRLSAKVRDKIACKLNVSRFKADILWGFFIVSMNLLLIYGIGLANMEISRLLFLGLGFYVFYLFVIFIIGFSIYGRDYIERIDTYED
ncbi:hypothetical protein [Curvivirga sp.]|uniref:hypothetical protein n=1 Tax=Curvivirga sp. TaxID=2856848 RepID=UPI003B5B39FC